MADYTYEQVMQALRNADEAGDAEAARRLAKIANNMRQSATATPPAQEPVSTASSSPMMDWFRRVTEKSMTPTYSGSVGSRMVEGALDPLYGIAQIGANIVGQGDTLNQQMRERERQLEAAAKEQGVGFIDWARLGGNVLSPINPALTRAVGTAAGAVPGTGAGAWLARSAGSGAILGAAQPVATEDDNYWTNKAGQAATGAIVGPAVEGFLVGSGRIIGAGKAAFTQKGQEEALRKYLQNLAGPERDEVIKALQDSQELVTGSKPTVAEVLADLPTAVDLLKKQAEIARTQGYQGLFEQRAQSQAAARARALKTIAGTEAQRARIASVRDMSTSRTREAALEGADEARVALKTIDEQVNERASNLIRSNQALNPVDEFADERFVDFLPVSSGEIRSMAAKEAAELKKFQVQSLADSGVFPIYAKDLTSQIDDAIARSESDMTKQVLGLVRSKLASKADKNGIISSRDLYENVRKVSNQEIAQLLGLGDQYASGGIPQQAAKALGEVKKMIDGSLNKSTNGLWTKYLTDYAAFSQKLNRMEVGDYLLTKLNKVGSLLDDPTVNKESLASFSTAIDNAANTVKKSTGMPRYEKLDDLLTKQEMTTVNRVLADLSRKAKSTRGAGVLDEPISNPAQQVPGLLSAKITLLKEVLDGAYRGNMKKVNDRIAQLMLEPADMAAVLASRNPRESQLLGKIMIEMADDANRRALIQLFTVPQAAQGRN